MPPSAVSLNINQNKEFDGHLWVYWRSYFGCVVCPIHITHITFSLSPSIHPFVSMYAKQIQRYIGIEVTLLIFIYLYGMWFYFDKDTEPTNPVCTAVCYSIQSNLFYVEWYFTHMLCLLGCLKLFLHVLTFFSHHARNVAQKSKVKHIMHNLHFLYPKTFVITVRHRSVIIIIESNLQPSFASLPYIHYSFIKRVFP